VQSALMLSKPVARYSTRWLSRSEENYVSCRVRAQLGGKINSGMA
jgi:hypothetical protein